MRAPRPDSLLNALCVLVLAVSLVLFAVGAVQQPGF